MSWLIFAILAPALYAVSSYFDKFLIEKKVKDPMMLTVFGGIVVFWFSAAIFFWQGMPVFDRWQAFMVVLSGISAEIALVPYYKALSLEETSRIAPLFQIIPLYILVLSYFFIGEVLAPGQLFGFFVVLAGAVLISLEKPGLHFFKIRKAFWYVMLSAILYAIPFVIFKYAAMRQNFWAVIVYEFFGVGLGAAILFVLYARSCMAQAQKIGASTWVTITANEIIYFIGRFCGFLAAALGPVALVSVIGSLNPFFVLLYGTFLSIWFPKIIKENIQKSTLFLKITAILLIFAGIWLVNA